MENKVTNFNPDDYVIFMMIGKGNFSELYVVEHKETKILYAMKLFLKARVEQIKKQEDVLMEKHVMQKIEPHDNIIGYYGSAKDNEFLYILYEYINGGELWQRSVVYGLPSENLVKFYFLQILDGISHLHSYNIVHRDIKPENIMVTKDKMTLKIIDFGSCKDMEGTEFEKKFDAEREKQKSRKMVYKNFVGTPNYMAPECVRNKNSDFKSDVWSLGCLLYQLFTGFPPFLGKSDYLVFKKSTECEYTPPEDIIPDDAMDLIKKLIVMNPEERLTVDEIYEHPFLSQENNSDRFRNQYPLGTLKDIAFDKIRLKLKNKYDKYKDISAKLEKIKNHEQMEEECKTNGVELSEDVKSDEAMLNLLSHKEELQNLYFEGLKELNEEIKNTISLLEGNIIDEFALRKIKNKFFFLEKQLMHDKFNITYE